MRRTLAANFFKTTRMFDSVEVIRADSPERAAVQREEARHGMENRAADLQPATSSAAGKNCTTAATMLPDTHLEDTLRRREVCDHVGVNFSDCDCVDMTPEPHVEDDSEYGAKVDREWSLFREFGNREL